jgi:zinc protease
MQKPKTPTNDRALLDAFWSEPVERTVLPNGLTLLVKPDRSASLASVQVWVRTGSIHEGAQLGAGLSHYLEHMLFKGTTKRNGRDISATVQANGGYINAYTTFDRTVYYIDIPSEQVEVAVDVLADAVLNSTLPEDEVIREKDVILREIAMTKDDPDSRLWEALFSTAFREHPYRQPIIGHRDVFAAADRAALADYYRQRYVPNNMVVVIAGDVGTTQARVIVERHFGGAPRSRLAPVLVPPEPLQLGTRRVQRFEKVEIVRAALAWAIPGLTDPAAPVLDMLASVLGSGESSLLWQEIREKKKLVHSIDASSWNPGTSGLFCISFTCDEGNREKAEAAILHLLKANGAPGSFTAAQVKKAYRQSVVSEINTCKTMAGQASRLGAAEVVVGDLDFGRTYFDRLAKVTPSEMVAALKEFLVPSRLTAVSLEPEPATVVTNGATMASLGARPDFEEVKLSNGARIVFQPDSRLPNLHMRLLTLGGPLCELPGKRGSSALLATLLTKDTRKRSAAAVAQRIEEVGGSFGSFSGDNTMGLSCEALPPDADRILGLLADGVLSPTFKAHTLEIERDAQLAALRQEKDDVVTFARKLLRTKFFGSHPFSVGSQGNEAGVSSTQPADLAALWKRLLVGEGTVLSVAGSFNPDKLLPKLEAFLAKVPKGRAVGAGPLFEGSAEPGEFVEIQPREQAVVLLGYPGAVVDAPDFYAGEVLDELFSGMASMLFERVREQKGLAYFVRSGRTAGRSTAMFYFMAGTQPGKEKEVLAEIAIEIERVQAGKIPPEEIKRCQVRLKAGLKKALQTNSARSMQAAIDVLQGRGANHWKVYDSLIDAVTVKDLAAFARRHLVTARRTQLVVRP